MERTSLQIVVIIPAYNVAPYVTEAVQSILNQPYPNIDIVCVNDGSTDETFDILQKISAFICSARQIKAYPQRGTMG